MSQNSELRFKVAPVWKGSYNHSITYDISDEVSFTAENVPVGETTNVTYGHYRSLKNNNTDPLTNDQSWLLILDLSNIETVTQQGKEYNQEFNENETLRKENERQRVENETIRVNNELTRKSNEDERKSAETRRVDAENNRNSAENDRKSNETARSTAELQRKNKEEERISNETARVNAETIRSDKESTRQNDETNRRSAETTRQNNETTRQNNENLRQQQEGAPTDDPNPTGSRWSRYKQAENERTLLFNNSQTNKTTLYNQAEGTPEDEASTNGSRWARFKKAEETRDTIVNEKVEDITNLQENVEDLKNTKANKDGYYSQMTVGSAENLVGQNVNSENYFLRSTGGESNEVANGIAEVVGLEGQSCVWNQLIPNNSLNISGDTSHLQAQRLSNGTIQVTVTGTLTQLTYVQFSNNITNLFLSGHKYLEILSRDIDTSVLGYNKIWWQDTTDTLIAVRRQFKNPSKNTNVTCYIYFATTVTPGTYNFTPQVIDLTLLGIDNLTTTAQVEAWLAQHVGTKPYYAYNDGEILSAKTLGFKTYGQNLLNPTTRQAKLIPYTWEENSNVYTIKNVPSGATATFTPDATGVAESVDISSGSLDITSYGSGILELSAATADTYVCMKWDEQKDDDAVPYEEHTYDFDVRKVYGKVNGAGEDMQCFPNGIMSACSAYDELTAERVIVRQVLINLGDLSWSLGDPSVPNVFVAINNFNGKPFTLNALITKGYKVVVSSNWYNVNDKQIRIGPLSSSFGVVIHDNDYNSASSFQAAMDGVFMICELNTPITYTDLIYRDNGVDTPLGEVLLQMQVNNWSMEEQLITPYADGNPTSIPATVNTIYSIDAVEALDTLQKTAYFADDVKVNLQALLTCINTNCSETLGGTFSISETATDKVFAFSFTPNTEPDVEPTNEGE